MPEILRVNGVSLLRDTVVVRELLTVESPMREIVTIGGQGPRGIDGEMIESAAVVGTALVLTTNHGQTISVSGSILGPTGPQGIQGIQGPQGEVGPVGPQGEVGPQGPQGIQGVQGEVGPQGATGPAGDTGPAGAAGADGTDGASAYEVAVANGFVGTESAWLDSLVGPAGPTGATGATGATGPAGADGADGADGQGVPIGGATGQLLAKKSGTDFDTEWVADPSDGKEPAITAGTSAQYWRGDKSWSEFFADVRAATLTGLSTAADAVITATDTVLSALGKLQKQVSDNLSTLTSHTSNTSNPHSTTKAQVGLGNVDNTSDADKPVSAATQTALNAKQDALVSGTNIKTINGGSVLGSGDLAVGGNQITVSATAPASPTLNQLWLDIS